MKAAARGATIRLRPTMLSDLADVAPLAPVVGKAPRPICVTIPDSPPVCEICL